MAFDRPTFIDIKTTGPDVDADQIIDFGAVRSDRGRLTDRFSQPADPGIPIPPHVTALTGIDPDTLFDCPSSADALRQFAAFVADDVLVAHDAAAVAAFLGHRIVNPILDTQELARIVFPALEHHDLDTVARHVGLDLPPTRRAESDAITIAKLFGALTDRLVELDLPVLQAVNRLAAPIDWDLKPLLAHAEQAKIASFADAVERDITAALTDFGELLKSARPQGTDADASQTRRELDGDWIAGLFEQDGPFAAALPTYEPRGEQIRMARAVADAYNAGQHAMIEAGTGTGKSLAYLVPSLYWAKWNREQIVISTNTKNLQQQLFHKDIPLVRHALDEPFEAALIKGRANYLCVRRFRYALAEADRELSPAERRILIPVITWAAQTETGDISENTAFLRSRWSNLWERLYSSGTECLGRACPTFRKCFLARARALSLGADVVIANHAVVFSEIGIPSPVLPEYRRLVFDEAHNIEHVATEHLGCRVNTWRFKFLLDRLYRKARADAGRGLLTNILFRLRLGKKKPTGKRKQIADDLTRCTELVPATADAADRFLSSLAPLFPRRTADRVRYHAADRDPAAWESVIQHKQHTIAVLAELTGRLKRVLTRLDDLTGDDDFEYRIDFVRELAGRLEACDELGQHIEFLIEANDENYVYWIEQDRDGANHVLAAAPIDISQVMVEQFYDRKASIILCSATMTANGRFDFVKERIGAATVDRQRLAEHNLGSPFDYARQVLLCVPTFLPEPGPQSGLFEQALAEFLIDLHLATQGRGLALFTSYAMLNHIYSVVKPPLQAAGLTVLGQGSDGERDQITAIFRRIVHSVLLGTHSFWEGVDLPGETLSCLTIAKLPFAVFTDPVVEARGQAVEKTGRNAFICYSVPSAVIRLRQGFGRLIRHRTDRGVIIVTDKRIVTRRYGRQFLNSLPARHRTFADKPAMIQTISEFLQ